MNDHDLEEQLRSQRGPREDGYVQGPLPASLETKPGLGPSRIARTGMLLGAAAAGTLVIILAAGFLSRPTPGTGSTTPSPAAATTCAASDVAFGAEAWGGAAGSRGTVVTVTLAADRSGCALQFPLTATISNASGKVLVSAASGSAGGAVDLGPGASFTLGIAWSNWCSPDLTPPVALSLTAPGWASAVPVGVPSGGDPIPPCNGIGSPSTLSVSALEPRP